MILCPVCGAKTRVLETRAPRRRRGCRVTGCLGKVTTVEVAVPDGQALAFAARLRDIVAQIEGGAS